ncbi:VOC family protein [Chloroflexota bacterium]
MENDVTEKKMKLPPLGQVGVVVKDLDKAVAYYSSNFGMGPWRFIEVDNPEAQVRNQTCRWKFRIAFTNLGPVEFELIQNLEGRSIHSEFLEKGREGLHHLGFFCTEEEKDRIIEELDEKEIKVIQDGKIAFHGGSYAYVDSDQIGGVIFEFIHRSSG